MATPATIQKRKDLMGFIERELVSEPAVQAVIGTGSIANGLARPDSDIDAIVFLDPYDLYVVPAESKWCPSDGSFHSIDGATSREHIQLDFARFDLAEWADATFEWPEPRCAELHTGWTAFDRSGQVTELIQERTAFTDSIRLCRLDAALVMLDQHLADGRPESRWESLGAVTAHDRLHAAYEHVVSALFAYNRCWRPWRDREMSALLDLPWLPDDFEGHILGALNAPSLDYDGFGARVRHLRYLFGELIKRLVDDSEYGKDVISEAFIRSHDEPGRAWNMDEWNQKHDVRKK